MGLKFRRGTTAQKSGSLAFGEPYVNTDLGTLQIGGNAGDITLGASGTGSQGSFAGISGSSLDITGNAKIDGNLTLGGAITIGDATADTVNVVASLSSSLIPSNDNSFDIGSTSKRYRNVYAQSISSSLLSNVTGSTNKLAYFSENNKVTSYSDTYVTTKTLGLGTSVTSSGAPERLMVDNANQDSYNIATFQTSMQNSYAEVNIKNFGSGSSSSTDLVIWNDATTEVNNYLDLGMNSSNYTAGYVGYDNDSYLFTTANDLYVGSMSTGSHGHLHLFGGGEWTTPAITIDDTNTINISSSIIPAVTNSYDLGSETNIWRDLYISTGSIKFVEGTTVVKTLTAATLTALEAATGSSNNAITNLNSFTSSIDTTIKTKMNTDGIISGSAQITPLLPLGTVSGSEQVTTLLPTGVVSGSSQITSSFAGLSSVNRFTGNQTITGSLYITNDLVVQGSASIQTISSSRLDIGDNIIQLNVNSPSLRFGGIEIYDSGSVGGSGSFLYDSLHDEFIFVHKGNGTNVTSSHFVLGPETYDNLGTETYLTNNRLPKGTGKEHLVDSNISDDGSLITLGSNTTITGTLVATGTPLVSGSSQIDVMSTTNIARLATTGSNSFIGNQVITGSLILSSSADVELQVIGNTVMSGSLTLSSSLATELIVIGNQVNTGNLVVTGSITTTGDVVAFSTSDKRHKNTIVLISDALSKVTKLNGVTWEWNDDVDSVTKETPKTGLIAQEVQEVLPEVVKERGDGFLALDYSKMMGLMVEAIKEQQTQIEKLKSEISGLQNVITIFEDRMKEKGLL
jgi:hypothetical protein